MTHETYTFCDTIDYLYVFASSIFTIMECRTSTLVYHLFIESINKSKINNIVEVVSYSRTPVPSRPSKSERSNPFDRWSKSKLSAYPLPYRLPPVSENPFSFSFTNNLGFRRPRSVQTGGFPFRSYLSYLE